MVELSPGSRTASGLTLAEAQRRLELEGPNELVSQQPRTLPRLVRDVLREPMLLLLVAAGALYLALGEARDAWALVGFVVVIVAITVFQERRTERALGALRDLSAPRALVVRDGRRVRIPGTQVVRGDVVVLAEGDRVAADALVREASGLALDESLLSGESAPVRKLASASAVALERPGGEDQASVYGSTLVTSGHALVEVVATGERSQVGLIGTGLAAARVEQTRLQLDTRRLVRRMAWLGMGLSAAIGVSYALTRGGALAAWQEGALAGIAAAMSLLPEEFAVVLSVYLAIGAWRLARRGVLARSMPAVEALGQTTVLCADKTGTLTENRMTLARVQSGTEQARPQPGWVPAPALLALLESAALASRREGFDPMDRALIETLDSLHAAQPRAQSQGELLREYPLTPALPALIRVWRPAGAQDLELACKGAPEAVARVCRSSAEERSAMLESAERLAQGGLRVLAVARARRAAQNLPDDPQRLELEIAGLLGFEDPMRASVPAAVAACQRAGIRVVMVTGDHPATACAIATGAGLQHATSVLTGAQLERLGPDELAERAGTVGVFARVLPEQKLRIVRALAARGEIVAMTGDGVNDAPALRAAHIGVAMGARGTDVAREAAGLVLLHDDFSALVEAVFTGRRIHDNIRRALLFVIAVHVPIGVLTLGQALVPAAPLLLLPVHLAFLELVIDPACSLVFEAEPAAVGVRERPPRARDEPLLPRAAVVLALLQGLTVAGTCAAVLLLARHERPPDVARAETFATLVLALVALMLSTRFHDRLVLARGAGSNPTLWIVAGVALSMLAAALAIPAARALLRFGPVSGSSLVLALGAGVACFLALEALKLPGIRRRRLRTC